MMLQVDGSVASGVICGRLFGVGCVTGVIWPNPKSPGYAVPAGINRVKFAIKNTWRWAKRGFR